jgi:hypothetical protein
MKAEAESISLSGEYVENPTWYADSGWKSEQNCQSNSMTQELIRNGGGPEPTRHPSARFRQAQHYSGKKWRLFIVYSHSSEILACPGEGLRGTALVAARFG